MSDTPETDSYVNRDWWTLFRANEHARELERERDEAREELRTAVQERHDFHWELLDTIRERDEAREKIERQADRIRYLEGATNHACGTPLSVALRERDEARDIVEKLSKQGLDMMDENKSLKRERNEAREKIEQQRKEIVRLNGATSHADGTPLKIALRERDEARNAIVGWENKWKCAVDMAARAELERDDALNKINDLKNILR